MFYKGNEIYYQFIGLSERFSDFFDLQMNFVDKKGSYCIMLCL